MKIVCILLAVFSFSSRRVSSQDDSMTGPEHAERCKFLNKVRANFTICCEYPTLVMWATDLNICEEQCASEGEPNDNCCILACCFIKIGALRQSEGGPIEVDPNGLIYSFLLSVGNDTQWLPVITESTQRCYDDIPNTYENDCSNRMPKQLYSIIDCCYKENFLKCAKWNPFDIKECEYTTEYVSICL